MAVKRNSEGQFIAGYPRTDEIKQKVRQTLLGHKVSKETREKIKQKLLGRKLTEEHANKVKKNLTSSKNQSRKNNTQWKGGISFDKEHRRFLRHQHKMKIRDVEGSHTEKEWLKLKRTYCNMCLCCKRRDIELTKDHIIPLTRGGTDYIWNIQPLCLSCNMIKKVKTIDYRMNYKILLN